MSSTTTTTMEEPQMEYAEPTKEKQNDFLKDTWERIKSFTVPRVSNDRTQLVLGGVNCVFFGVGTFVAGIMNRNIYDVVIGVGQLHTPFVGWLWSMAWGVKMMWVTREKTHQQ